MIGTWKRYNSTIEVSVINDIPVLKIGEGAKARTYSIRTDKKPMTVAIAKYDTTWDIIYDDKADILYLNGEEYKRIK